MERALGQYSKEILHTHSFSNFPLDQEGRKERYRELMLTTSRLYASRAVAYVHSSVETSSLMGDAASEILETKRGVFDTRGYFLTACYELAGGKNWEAKLPEVGAAVALTIASMYHSNRIIDRKSETTTLRGQGMQTLAGGFNSFLALNIIEDSPRLTHIEKQSISRLLRDLNLRFNEGQMLDITRNSSPADSTVPNLDEITERNFLINAYFYEVLAEIGYLLSESADENMRTALISFGRNYGIAQQIVNDIADFTPDLGGVGTAEKVSADAYADFRNGRITLPISVALERLQDDDRTWFLERLGQGELSREEANHLTTLLWNSGVFKDAQLLALEYREMAKEAIAEFSPTQKAPLEGLLVMVKDNRYYRTLRDFARSQTSD